MRVPPILFFGGTPLAPTGATMRVRADRAFTFVEMLVVVGILLLLFTGVIRFFISVGYSQKKQIGRAHV